MKVRIAKPLKAHHAPAARMRRGHEMKLEPDLMRSLLLYVEEHANRPISQLTKVEIEGYSDDAVAYHVILAEEEDLIKAIIHETHDTEDEDVVHIEYDIQRLTNRGHEFIDSVRDSRIWKKVKAGAAQAGIVTIKALFQFAVAYAKTEVEKHLGGSVLPSAS